MKGAIFLLALFAVTYSAQIAQVQEVNKNDYYTILFPGMSRTAQGGLRMTYPGKHLSFT